MSSIGLMFFGASNKLNAIVDCVCICDPVHQASVNFRTWELKTINIIKPHNILLTRAREMCFFDFGVVTTVWLFYVENCKYTTKNVTTCNEWHVKSTVIVLLNFGFPLILHWFCTQWCTKKSCLNMKDVRYRAIGTESDWK